MSDILLSNGGGQTGQAVCIMLGFDTEAHHPTDSRGFVMATLKFKAINNSLFTR